MQRITLSPRPDWQKKVEEKGLIWHTYEGVPYWNESAAYKFTTTQIDAIETATADCYELFLLAGDEVIKKRRLSEFGIPEQFHNLIRDAWENEPPALNYGRFDFVYDGVNPPKLLEFNCDTPTSLLEASVVQWYWKEDVFPSHDQYNSIHEELVAKWAEIHKLLPVGQPLHFTMGKEPSGEDAITTSYMADVAAEAGFQQIIHLPIDDIGWTGFHFVDLEDLPIETMFKLFPWEWLVHQDYGQHLLTAPTVWLEPIWKMIWSNKAILPVLAEIAPNHPNILHASFDKPLYKHASYVKKPILSREGANVTIVKNGSVIAGTDGDYGEEGFIYQELAPIPAFDGKYPIIGSWIVDGTPCGMGIREDGLITGNLAQFVPHIIQD